MGPIRHAILPGPGLARLLALLALAVLPSAAAASPTQQSIFMDDDLLLYRGADRTDSILRELRALGVDTVRASMHWRAVAPGRRAEEKPHSLGDSADPASYPPENWDIYDTLVRTAKRYGINVFFNVTGGAPLWATGKLHGKHVSLQYLPDPREFEKFMTAVGRRFSGTYRDENQGRRGIPNVRIWSIWNEPNHGAQLQPQWRTDPISRKVVPYSPHWYRRLFRAAQGALFRSGHSGDVILLGETAPRGDNGKGIKRHLRPMRFLREFFCIDANGQPFDPAEERKHACDYRELGAVFPTGYAHHPYSITAPPTTPGINPDDALLGDTPKLLKLLDRASEMSRLTSRLPLWYTEYGYQTKPPDPIRGVSLQQQSDWLAEAELFTWREPRIFAHTQFLMLDTLPRHSYPVNSRKYWGTYQSGLRWADGTAKPAYHSYFLPFVASPARAPLASTGAFWGMVRPGVNGQAQAVRMEFRAAGASSFSASGPPFTVTDPRGYFTTTRTLTQGGDWRFAWLNAATGQWLPSPSRAIAVG